MKEVKKIENRSTEANVNQQQNPTTESNNEDCQGVALQTSTNRIQHAYWNSKIQRENNRTGKANANNNQR